MENYLKNNKGFTIKELIFTIIAIIIAFVAGFALSYVINNNNKSDLIYDDEQSSEILYDEDEEEVEEEELSTDDILFIAYDDAINKIDYFEYDDETDTNSTKKKITNYEELLDETFTENGKKIFEQENKNLIEINGNDVYLLPEYENIDDHLLDVEFENIKETGDTITATAVRTMSKQPIKEIEDEENIEEYTLKDEIVLKYVDGNWLIDKYTLAEPEQ